jgi:hypothetical protein
MDKPNRNDRTGLEGFKTATGEFRQMDAELLPDIALSNVSSVSVEDLYNPEDQ